MHISSLQLWQGVGAVSGDNLGTLQTAYNMMEMFTWSGQGDLRLSVPAMDANGYMYYTCQRTIDNQFSIIKTQSDGTIVWQKLTGIINSATTQYYALFSPGRVRIMTDDSIWVACGNILMKISHSGSVIFSKSFTNLDFIYDFHLDSSNNMLLFGYSHVVTSMSTLHLIKLNSLGTFQWDTTFPYDQKESTADSSRYLYNIFYPSLVIDSGGYIFINGMFNFYSFNNSGNYNTSSLIKINPSTGAIMSQTEYMQNNGTAWSSDAHIGIDSNDNIYVKGGAATLTNAYTQAITKINSSLAVVWSKILAYPPSGYQSGQMYQNTDILTDSTGNSYILIGPYYSTTVVTAATEPMRYNLIKYNNAGAIQYQRSIVINGLYNSNYTTQRPYFNWGPSKTSFLCRFPVGNGTNAYSYITFKMPIDGTLTGTFYVNSIAVTIGTSTLSVSDSNGMTKRTVTWTTSTATESSSTPSLSFSDAGFTSTATLIGTNIVPASTSVAEGSSLTFNVSSTAYPNSTLYYNLNTTLSTATTADFTSYSGSFVMTAGVGSFSVTLASDSVYEIESFVIDVKTTSISGTVIASSQSITIQDSISATFTAYPTSIDEGQVGSFTVTTTGLANGSTLYYNLNQYSNSTTADFTTYSGSFTINSNTGTFTVTVANDNLQENGEYFFIDVRATSINGPIIATSPQVTFVDGVLFSVDPTSVLEGGTATFSITTASSFNGQTLWYGLAAATTATTADFTSYQGTVVPANKTATFTISPALDTMAESETFTIDIRLGSSTGTVLATSQGTSILDKNAMAWFEKSNSGSTHHEVSGMSGIYINIYTYGIPAGTTLYVELNTAFSSATSADFNYQTTTVTVSDGNITSFTIAGILQDTTVEFEYCAFNVRIGSATGAVLDTSMAYRIIDYFASFPYSTATASFTTSSYGYGFITPEGQTTSYWVTTTGLADGTNLYLTRNSNSNANATFNTLTSPTVVSGNKATVYFKVQDDGIPQLPRYAFIDVRTGSASGTIVATTGPLLVVDSYVTGSTVTWGIPTNITEGSVGTIGITTTNLPNGYILFWQAFASGSTGSGYVPVYPSQGLVTINNNYASINLTGKTNIFSESASTFFLRASPSEWSSSQYKFSDSSSISVINATGITSTQVLFIPSYPFIGSSTNYTMVIDVQIPMSISDSTLYWAFNADMTTTTSSFSTSPGSFSVSNHWGEFTLVVSSVNRTSGYFKIDIKTGSTAGTVIGTSDKLFVR